MKIVVDANVIIDHLRRNVSDTLYASLFEKGHIFMMSIVTIAELYSGKSAQVEGWQRVDLEQLLSGVEIISPTLSTAKLVGKLRIEHKLSLGDAFVAALALEMAIPLTTFNTRHFQHIPSLNLYTP